MIKGSQAYMDAVSRVRAAIHGEALTSRISITSHVLDDMAAAAVEAAFGLNN